MSNANGVATPMLRNYILNKHGSYFVLNPHLYCSMVGALQYVTLTRPDIAFNVNKACEFIDSPIESH